MKIAIVTDSTAVLKEETKNSDCLRVVTVPLIIDGVEQNDLAPAEYYEKLKHTKNFPSTAQPSIGEMANIYESLAQEGYDEVVSIHISSGISGFCNTLKANIDDLSPIPVHIFDSLSTSLPMGAMVDSAVEKAKAGEDATSILDWLEKMRIAQCIYLVVDDLQHLVRTGRLSNGTALIGSLLQIKPILKFDEEGKIVLFKKVRTAKKAYKEAIDLVLEELELYKMKGWVPEIGIAHTNIEERAADYAKILEEKTGYPVRIVDLGNVIGTHTGEKTLGFGIMRKA